MKQLLQEYCLIGQLDTLKRIILDRLNGKRKIRLVGLEEEYNKVHQLVEQTIVAGEGNSMLVIGARGSGKSNLVETVISDLSLWHKKDFHVVRLSGFIHTDDKLALREIWRQLGREMEVEDDAMGRTSNYADTLASLLALLSHPAEFGAINPDQIAKSVIFIMDEFDLLLPIQGRRFSIICSTLPNRAKPQSPFLGLLLRLMLPKAWRKESKAGSVIALCIWLYLRPY
jgi:origin recognition complex subunit 4